MVAGGLVMVRDEVMVGGEVMVGEIMVGCVVGSRVGRLGSGVRMVGILIWLWSCVD